MLPVAIEIEILNHCGQIIINNNNNVLGIELYNTYSDSQCDLPRPSASISDGGDGTLSNILTAFNQCLIKVLQCKSGLMNVQRAHSLS